MNNTNNKCNISPAILFFRLAHAWIMIIKTPSCESRCYKIYIFSTIFHTIPGIMEPALTGLDYNHADIILLVIKRCLRKNIK